MQRNMENCGKPLVLTFDDGPDARYTGRILDILKKEQIPAAFFVVGNHGMGEPELLRRMEKEGHMVGSHSLSHKNLLFFSEKKVREDFNSCRKIHKKILGKEPYYFRPPWGMKGLFTEKLAKEQGMEMVLWDVMAEDWRADGTSVGIAGKLMKRVFPGAVICLHDGGEDTGGAPGAPLKTIKALEIAIPLLKREGYRFISLDEYFQKRGDGNGR